MGYQEIQSLDANVTIAIGKVDKATGKQFPKSAEGYYLGSRKVENKRGESSLHFLQTEKGNLGVWGTTDLDRKLSSVKPGVMVRVTFTGKKPTPNGDMYVYRVEQDQNNTIEVNVEASAPAYEADEDLDSEDTDNEESDFYAGSEALAQPLATKPGQLTAAERQAKVQAKLNSRK